MRHRLQVCFWILSKRKSFRRASSKNTESTCETVDFFMALWGNGNKCEGEFRDNKGAWIWKLWICWWSCVLRRFCQWKNSAFSVLLITFLLSPSKLWTWNGQLIDHYDVWFPLVFVDGNVIYMYNHLKFNIHVYKVRDEDYRMVEFEVEPQSIKHLYDSWERRNHHQTHYLRR